MYISYTLYLSGIGMYSRELKRGNEGEREGGRW